MHPCLSLDEILRLLARVLVMTEAKATAAALACCCKTFEEPALDVLWETQNRLIPLLECLPRDAWEEEDGSFVSLLTGLIFSRLKRLIQKVFQENPDESGMDQFPKVCSKNSETHGGRHWGPHIF